MSSVGIEPTIPEFEWAKIFHVLDCAATVIGVLIRYIVSNYWTLGELEGIWKQAVVT
jgi:hypothetical protein